MIELAAELKNEDLTTGLRVITAKLSVRGL
jgi:hypothetical protein